ncbi:Disease resistance RPS2-like protein [Theobroma cacao]|uniref:Disease resistance RPS2-like protein n=1 Tax=Theobroma cacao TaxID=3641 RepID=A0A061FRR8_THECC|nr:Disease resistance RPS2-like protein [Theobroma cacao]
MKRIFCLFWTIFGMEATMIGTFFSPLEVGGLRSKIIMTTWNQNVSSIMRSVPDYSLKELPSDDCLFILAQHSLGEKGFNYHLNLKEIREQIVKKCNGLPLAAKTIGGLPHTRVDPDAWQDVLENEIWNSSEEKCGGTAEARVIYALMGLQEEAVMNKLRIHRCNLMNVLCCSMASVASGQKVSRVIGGVEDLKLTCEDNFSLATPNGSLHCPPPYATLSFGSLLSAFHERLIT